jgi:hypothetical protein
MPQCLTRSEPDWAALARELKRPAPGSSIGAHYKPQPPRTSFSAANGWLSWLCCSYLYISQIDCLFDVNQTNRLLTFCGSCGS